MAITNFLSEAFAAPNLLLTLLLLVVLLYWLMVLAGAFSPTDFDIDLDVEADADVEVGTTGGGLSWLGGALQFFHFGKLPFMVVMSFAILPAWMLHMLANHYLGQGSMGFALAMLIPVLFVGLLVSKVVTTPLMPIFQALDTAEEALDYIGMMAQLTLPASDTRPGQARILHEHAPLLLTVRTEPGTPELPTGTQVVISRRAEQPNQYIVTTP